MGGVNDYLKIALGVWGFLVLVGFGMRAFDEFADWIRRR